MDKLAQSVLESFFPKSLLDYFEIVDFIQQDDDRYIYLDEKKSIPEELKAEDFVCYGFAELSTYQDFPIRGRACYLKIRRRKWKDRITGKIVKREWQISSKGTRYTIDFAAFLKQSLDDTPISVTSLEHHYHIKSNNLQKQYKNHLSS